jgi:signal peptidase II
MMRDNPNIRLWAVALASLLGTLFLDLWTKNWVWTRLRPTGEVIEILPPTLELAFAFNRGTAFSVVREVGQPLWFIPITIAVLALTISIAVRSPGLSRMRMFAVGLACGGALGNLHDRLFRVDFDGHHGVVDFIKVNYPWGGSWPSFNVADSALVVGTALLMLSLMRADKATADPQSTSQP